MSKENNGGSAFPIVISLQEGGPVYNLGMTLRDYFAAKALHYALKNCFTFEGAAEEAYEIADRMLKAREL